MQKLNIIILILSSFLMISTAEFPKLGGYLPNSDVEQHSRIDLDQRDFEAFLKESKWQAASDIFIHGGNSMKSIKIDLKTPLEKTFNGGSEVTQGQARGKLYADAEAGETRIKIGVTSKCAENYARTPNKAACFENSKEISIDGEVVGAIQSIATPFSRTLAGFSSQAENKMKNQRMFEMYRSFYGAPDYANKFVLSALNGSSTQSGSLRMNFTGKSDIYRIECAQKGSSYWNVWMYMIREMEDAIKDCNQSCIACNDAPVHAWDEAAAFYVGSLEKTNGSLDGKLLYRLAEKRCENFKTCKEGRSAVNENIMAKLNEGRNKLANSKCEDVKEIRDRIIKAMTIPLIQGTLRYAYKIGKLNGGDKEKAEGVAFLGAVLPQVNKCSKDDDATLVNRMWIDGEMGKDGFEVVREAFERNYKCLGVTCEDVGGLMDKVVGDYYEGFHPCTAGGSGNMLVTHVVVAVVVVVVALLVIWLAKDRLKNLATTYRHQIPILMKW